MRERFFETLSENIFNLLSLVMKSFDWVQSLNIVFTENFECIASWSCSFI